MQGLNHLQFIISSKKESREIPVCNRQGQKSIVNAFDLQALEQHGLKIGMILC